MDFALIVESLPRFLSGALLTAELVVQALVYGMALALPIALMRVSANPFLLVPAYGYIFFFRGTPLLVQIYLIYYGSGQYHVFLDDIGLWVVLREAYWCALIALTLNTAGYTAEIIRGGIRAVAHGEIEAARAAGMSRSLLYRRIILPSAFRLALPAYSNEVIMLLKGSSLVSTITLMDLMGVTRTLNARTYAVWEMFLMAGAIYLLMSFVVIRCFKLVERRLNRHLDPPADHTKNQRQSPTPAGNSA